MTIQVGNAASVRLESVETDLDDDRAQALYEPLAFVAAALRPRYYPGGKPPFRERTRAT